jgi:hypothetical protein
MIVIDNLGTVSGGVDENSPQMKAVMSNLRRLADVTGAAVIVIHHQRKSNGFKGRVGDTLRGHSSIEAALDLALLVERDEESGDSIKVKSTKTRNVEVMPFSATFIYKHKLNSYELAEAQFLGLEPEKDESLIILHNTILACAKSSPGVNQTRLNQLVKDKLPKAGINKIREEILALTDSGKLKTYGGETGKALAYYPNDEYIEF